MLNQLKRVHFGREVDKGASGSREGRRREWVLPDSAGAHSTRRRSGARARSAHGIPNCLIGRFVEP
jgi:hypothetical protein